MPIYRGRVVCPCACVLERTNCSTFWKFSPQIVVVNNDPHIKKICLTFHPSPHFISTPYWHRIWTYWRQFHRTAHVSIHLANAYYCFQCRKTFYTKYKWYDSNDRKWVSPHIFWVLSNASSRFSSKINVSNSFKTLLVPDSKVFFPWFETEINQISSSPEKAMVNIYKMILKILKCVTIQVCYFNKCYVEVIH